MKGGLIKKMNKVVLKQTYKKEEKSEDKDKKKQKKKEKKKEESFTLNKLIIRTRLLNHFSHHIGEENKTNREEIFQVVVGVHSYKVNGFMRFYWWDIIEKEIRKLRKEEKCFVIKKGGYYFVLKEQDEADYFRKVCDRAIKGMENAQVKADEWVEKEKWKDVESYSEVEEENQDEDETNNKIKEDNENKTYENKTNQDESSNNQRKIIKLWKGENEN